MIGCKGYTFVARPVFPAHFQIGKEKYMLFHRLQGRVCITDHWDYGTRVLAMDSGI